MTSAVVLGALQALACSSSKSPAEQEPEAGPEGGQTSGDGAVAPPEAGSTALPDTGAGGAGAGGAGEVDAGAADAAPSVDGGAEDSGCVYSGPPLVDVTAFEACPLCDDAHCVPVALVTEGVELLADCEDLETKCVPDMYIETGGAFLLESCTSLGGAEGRCVSVCVPLVAKQQSRLPQHVCGENERCAPCYDPITGEESGACSISCDTGPVDPPYVFAECCDGISVCVPWELVPAGDRASLWQDSCTDVDDLCVPKQMASDPDGYAPENCRSWGGAEARCLPACLPEVVQNAARLGQQTCPDDYLCSPCYDTVTGEETLACYAAGDTGPQEDPYVFPRCCGGLSSCIPVEAIRDEDEAKLGVDTCEGEGVLCVPEGQALDPLGYIPDHCLSWNGSEGRCLPACLPDVAAQADMLDQGTCVSSPCDCELDGYLCAPCYDPLTGEDTGACRSTEADSPVEDPYTFSECCASGPGSSEYLSLCIPDALVPDEQEPLLSAGSCADADNLCVPKPLTAEPDTWVPDACRSWNDSEGRCLPYCLPDVAAQIDMLDQGVCVSSPCDCESEGYLCVPCYDPITAENTGACMVTPADSPVEEPYTFSECCERVPGSGEYLSLCVPAGAIPDEQESMLDADSCSDENNLCVPKPLTTGPDTWVPDECDSWNGAEGRCLPACLPDVAAQADMLDQGSCVSSPCDCELEGYLCVPCYDPLTGEDTGSCSITPADSPVDDLYTFPECCGGLSLCIPDALVPDEQESMLEADSCSDENNLCVPKPLTAEPDTWVPDECVGWGNTEGRCLPACLPDVAARADQLSPGACVSSPCDCETEGYLCVPCHDPVTGESTGACVITPADQEPAEAQTFPKCCDQSGTDRGTCVPFDVIPPDQQSNFTDAATAQECDSYGLPPAEEFRCVPTESAIDPNHAFPTCTVWILLPFDGVCMADCFLPSNKSPGDLQGNCPNELDECLPCDFGAPCQ